MYLTRHHTPDGARWALDYRFLPRDFHLGLLLQLPRAAVTGFLGAIPRDDTAAAGKLLAPVEPAQEVWAAGVTYLRSREAREAESSVKDVYTRVYEAPRPELFFKAVGARVVGHLGAIRVRDDSAWNVPEPELTLVVNAFGELVGYCAGNDVSSRDIESENPLYLPQAKVYEGSCAVGPGIRLVAPGEDDRLRELTIGITISRGGGVVFQGETRTSQIKRPFGELVSYLSRELDFPSGVFLMTGTGIVPPNEFSLQRADVVRITVGPLTLENEVERRPRSKKA
jgi:2-dehydro-3-deoxy-D-arabinonate dehydratase